MPTHTFLLSGLRSTGKSSLVCALWNDAQLLPTAERDCTQTNSVIRAPAEGESDRQVRLIHLPRERAIDCALRGAACYRIVSFLREVLEMEAAKLEEGPPETRLRAALAAIRKLFREVPRLHVLHEALDDDVRELDLLLETLDAPGYPGPSPQAAHWDERRDHLMGRRGEDGRILDTGRLQTLDRVELLRATTAFGPKPPELIDPPGVPAFHGGRRQDLVLEMARRATRLLIAHRPEICEPEDWLLSYIKENPAAKRSTLLVFNQIDTADTAALFGRDGFNAAFDATLKNYRDAGIATERVYFTCARLPFLEMSRTDDADPLLAERIARLKKRLARLADAAQSRGGSLFRDALLAASTAPDAGIAALRSALRDA
jgi:hypothetical protein